MLLILFWVSVLMFYFSYMFSVLFLAFFVLLLMLFYFGNMMYLKYLIILVYLSGIVIFILYISCMCWLSNNSLSLSFLGFSVLVIYLYDSGIYFKISNLGDSLWMFLFFSFIFNILVMVYSLSLYKVSGSLRF